MLNTGVGLVIALALALVLPGSAYADMRVNTSEALKAAIAKPPPAYSAVARQMKISGHVEIEIGIGVDGSVETVKVVSGNPLLSVTATTTVKKWKFNPFTSNGEPTKAVTVVAFDFKP